jgi:hypothetical protein
MLRSKRSWLTWFVALSGAGTVLIGACSSSSGPIGSTCTLAGARCQYGCAADLGCVNCLSDADCKAGAPLCVLGTCTACRVSTDCGTGQVCEPASHTCATACTTNAECNNGLRVPGNLEALICDTTSKTCVGCQTNADCSAARPVCEPNRMQCSECASSRDCPKAAPACNLQTGDCVQCLTDLDCGPSEACATDHLCHAYCRSNADCTTKPRLFCDTATGVCGQCATNADCAGGANGSICETATHACVQCAANSDCSASAPTCRNGTCIQCTRDSECTTATLPHCDAPSNLCVQCRTSADCPTATPTCQNNTCA